MTKRALANLAILVVTMILLAPPAGNAQPVPSPEPAGDAANPSLLTVPVSRLSPGPVQVRPDIANPSESDPQAIARGQNYFNQFNCVGCHAPNGGGGMGPALSNHKFIYGDAPAQIYLSILQGRPNGMPAWNTTLPQSVIWDLVAYIHSISKDPLDPWQNTISLPALNAEQVPAEAEKTADPWGYVESFSYGLAPNQHGSKAFPNDLRQ